MLETELRKSLARLQQLEQSVRLRHWVSLKTQPVAPLVHAAMELGLGIDVVSEFELAGAISSGVPAERILVNGVAKHAWLGGQRIPGLCVHFDSLAEVSALAESARKLRWRIGLRCAVPHTLHHEHGAGVDTWDQFGLTLDELHCACRMLAAAGVPVRGLHFHLHTNLQYAAEVAQALEYVAEVAAVARIEPEYIDIGGGLPIDGESPLHGVSAAATFSLAEFRGCLADVPALLPSVGEIWLENGRFLTGGAGALVLTVLDSKERGGSRYLICDGGRVNHARMASIEKHEIQIAPARAGALRETIVCGPTCSAVDRLGCWMLPESIRQGDRVIWLTAGAYHIPLETRFSVGLAPVVWFDGQLEPEVIRKRETAAQWWGQWTPPNECMQLPRARSS